MTATDTVPSRTRVNTWSLLDVGLADKFDLMNVICACRRASDAGLIIREVESRTYSLGKLTIKELRSEAAYLLRLCEREKIVVPDLPETPPFPVRREALYSDLFA